MPGNAGLCGGSQGYNVDKAAACPFPSGGGRAAVHDCGNGPGYRQLYGCDDRPSHTAYFF